MRLYYSVETGLVEFTLSTDLTGLLRRQVLPFVEVETPLGDIDQLYILEGAQALRPLPPMCPEGLAAGAAWDWSSLPVGSIVTVANQAGETLEVTDFSEPLTFSDSGTYIVSVAPPPPYLDHTYVVEILNA